MKYDVMTGMSQVSSDEIDIDIEWNQDEITPSEYRWGNQLSFDDFKENLIGFDENDVLNTYTVRFDGAMDNPTEFTIQEMIDLFGTVTETRAQTCVLNGAGGTLISQEVVTGIPVNKILEYCGMHEDVSLISPIGLDGYYMPLVKDVFMDSEALLVFDFGGEPVPDNRGYPLVLMPADGNSAGSGCRYVSEVIVEVYSEEELANHEYVDYIYGTYGETFPYQDTEGYFGQPNIGVLTAKQGQVFSIDEAVHLEGYAYGYYEPITKIEFSLDRGETWTEVAIPDMDINRWVYWKIDMNNLETGAYLLQLRATVLQEDGEERITAVDPRFFFNVQ